MDAKSRCKAWDYGNANNCVGAHNDMLVGNEGHESISKGNQATSPQAKVAVVQRQEPEMHT